MDDVNAINTTTTTHAHGLATLPPSSSTTSTTSTELLQHPLGLASSLLQASTSYYYDYNAVRDRQGRMTRAGAADAPAALHRLMDTDEAMDDVDAHIYTTTIIMHGEREAKTEDDDYGSLIGGTPAS